MSDPRTHEVHGDEGMPAEFIDEPELIPGDGDAPTGDRNGSTGGSGEPDSTDGDPTDGGAREPDGSDR